jgi:hypothetical protein
VDFYSQDSIAIDPSARPNTEREILRRDPRHPLLEWPIMITGNHGRKGYVGIIKDTFKDGKVSVELEATQRRETFHYSHVSLVYALLPTLPY